MVAVLLDSTDKRDGRVYTPESLAEALCAWAIRAPTDRVLDLGVGEGAFLLAAGGRLRALGASSSALIEAIYGAELDATVHARAQSCARERFGAALPHVVHGDFYEMPVPMVEAVVGNPPYIRRHFQGDPTHSRRAAGLPGADGLTDAYCYFLLRACTSLRPGGRLAVVTSASWLDMRYGQALKRALLADGFSIRLVLGFDGRVFSDALVKPVVLLAERRPGENPVTFARLSQGLDLAAVPGMLAHLVAGERVPGVDATRVPRLTLDPAHPWSVHLKAPAAYADLLRHGRWVPLRSLADSRIGLQTFAKPFYILTRAEAARRGIEPGFLLPLAFSPRDMRSPEISEAGDTGYVVFACDQPMEALHGTRAAWHIRMGMQATVPVRGTDQTVVGYHQAPRLRRAGREPWYNLRTEITHRGTWPILLPRRIFMTFAVIHNRAHVIANEDFLELRPWESELVEPLLAVFNSSVGEFLVRTHAFQYGGGVFNLNPGAVRALPLPDLLSSPAPSRAVLAEAWRGFVAEIGSAAAKRRLDHVVADALALPETLRTDIARAVAHLTRSAREVAAPHGSGRAVSAPLR